MSKSVVRVFDRFLGRWTVYSAHRGNVQLVRRNYLLFSPGILLLVTGILFVVAPTLMIAIVSGFLMFFGTLFCIGAWKIVQLKRRIEDTIKKFDGKVVIQGVNLNRSEQGFSFEQGGDSKRTIFH